MFERTAQEMEDEAREVGLGPELDERKEEFARMAENIFGGPEVTRARWEGTTLHLEEVGGDGFVIIPDVRGCCARHFLMSFVESYFDGTTIMSWEQAQA